MSGSIGFCYACHKQDVVLCCRDRQAGPLVLLRGSLIAGQLEFDHTLLQAHSETAYFARSAGLDISKVAKMVIAQDDDLLATAMFARMDVYVTSRTGSFSKETMCSPAATAVLLAKLAAAVGAVNPYHWLIVMAARVRGALCCYPCNRV